MISCKHISSPTTICYSFINSYDNFDCTINRTVIEYDVKKRRSQQINVSDLQGLPVKDMNFADKGGFEPPTAREHFTLLSSNHLLIKLM